MIVSKDISYHAPKDHQVVVMNNLSHPLIVHVHENGRVFYFEMDASGGKKHFMKQLFYKEARCEALNQFVIREVPRDLTQHIPGGSTLDNNHSLIRKWCTDDSVNNNHNHNRNSHKQKTSL